MEFDKSNVYTALNADELKVGSKCYLANTMEGLKGLIQDGSASHILTLGGIQTEGCEHRFRHVDKCYTLAYLVSEPEEKKLKWTDLKIGDVIKNIEGTYSYMVIGIDNRKIVCGRKSISHILINDTWLDDDDLEYWEKVE